MTLRITENQSDGVTVLALSGHLVMGEESQQLKRQVEALVEQSQTNVIMHMEGVAYIDSFGVGELVSCVTIMKKNGGMLKLVNPTQFVREVLRVTHLDTVIPIFDTEAEAIHSQDAEGGTGSTGAKS